VLRIDVTSRNDGSALVVVTGAITAFDARIALGLFDVLAELGYEVIVEIEPVATSPEIRQLLAMAEERTKGRRGPEEDRDG